MNSGRNLHRYMGTYRNDQLLQMKLIWKKSNLLNNSDKKLLLIFLNFINDNGL